MLHDSTSTASFRFAGASYPVSWILQTSAPLPGNLRVVKMSTIRRSSMEAPEYFECRCSTAEHTMRFWLDEEQEPCVYASVFLSDFPWYARIWAGIRHALGFKSKFGHFEEFILRPEDRQRLVSLLNRLKVRKGRKK